MNTAAGSVEFLCMPLSASDHILPIYVLVHIMSAVYIVRGALHHFFLLLVGSEGLGSTNRVLKVTLNVRSYAFFVWSRIFRIMAPVFSKIGSVNIAYVSEVMISKQFRTISLILLFCYLSLFQDSET
jgi:hypothetical protein